ncbi:hypothetical protein BE08_11935 [Sorangium cellulosum]|uniref:DUF4935 domain-containing protein n=1 Tax=Sorangium cellulosum TaxID=56 RepID=A0A150P394_SORCE|nr:hypothetical protein BE08_11935 [Sorangium cellulosum]
MNHVFVETNFFIDVLRPFPITEAQRLLGRHGTDLQLYVPWCSITEAKRTIERIIREDLAFVDGAGRFYRRLNDQYRGSPSRPVDLTQIRGFIDMARTVRRDALFNLVAQVDGLAARLDVIPPSPAVIQRTLKIFPVKSLPPFDEMVLGAVLAHAEMLHARGETELFFCNLNAKDFAPTTGNELDNAYAAAGLRYLDSFQVP